MANFYVRAAAHDSLTVDGDGNGGADGSFVLNPAERERAENAYDRMSTYVWKSSIAIASLYDISVADVIALCGAEGSYFTGGPNPITRQGNRFVVGRLDSDVENPRTLSPPDQNIQDFQTAFESRGFTLEEAVCLLGSHSVLDNTGCLNNDKTTFCNPYIASCTRTNMFTWDTSYYRDLCTIKTCPFAIGGTSAPGKPNHEFLRKHELCKFTSAEGRKGNIAFNTRYY